MHYLHIVVGVFFACLKRLLFLSTRRALSLNTVNIVEHVANTVWNFFVLLYVPSICQALSANLFIFLILLH